LKKFSIAVTIPPYEGQKPHERSIFSYLFARATGKHLKHAHNTYDTYDTYGTYENDHIKVETSELSPATGPMDSAVGKSFFGG